MTRPAACSAARLIAALAAAVPAALILAETALATPAPLPAPDWPRATPAQAGFRGEALQALTGQVRAGRLMNGLHCLVMVRGGYLFYEECFNGQQADELHTLQSVSKSVTSALVGIAIERGAFSGVDENVLGIFPERTDIKNLDARKRAIRLEDLLTMRSGTDYHERGSDSPHFRLNRLASGWDRFYLDRPMIARPGTRFRYDSGAVILTSSLLKQRTGMHADAYADKYLFQPLGISARRWHRNGEGHPHTGGGLYLSPRDMAKFGFLYLRNGKWGDRQIIPESWVRLSTRTHVTFERRRHYDRVTGYGYWWWIMQPDPQGAGRQHIYGALGFRGQHILVVPEHDLVVVTTAGMGPGMHRPVDVLYTHILPALSRE